MIATTRRALSRSTAVGSPICTLRIGHDGCRAGREDSTEIVGAEGKVTVKMQSQTNVVRVYEALGVRREILGTYYARFEQVFVTGANGFMAACLDDGKLPMKLSL